MRRLSFIAALVLAVACEVAAQDYTEPRRNEISGTFGHMFISNQAVLDSGLSNPVVTFGAGYSFEVNYARIFLDRQWFDLAAEVPAIFNPDEDLHYAANQVPEGYGSIFITPAARLRLIPTMMFSPWFSFGGGFGHFGSNGTLIYGGSNSGNRGVTGGVLQGGVGLDVTLPCECTEHFKIRAEARDNWSPAPALNVNTGRTRQHNYYVAVGVAYRF